LEHNPASRVERKKLEARERILKAAEQIFIFESSYEQSTIREIAKRADVGVGSVYLHFKTKLDILGALVVAHQIEIKNRLRKAIRPENSSAENLEAMLRFFDELRKDKVFVLYGRSQFLVSFSVLDEGLRRMFEKEFSEICSIATEFFKTGIADGSFSLDVDPDLAAVTIMNMSSSFIRDILFERPNYPGLILRPYTNDEMLQAFRSFIRNALLSDSAKRARVGSPA
jgi:AcrR family transcriptional regulator